MKTFLKRFLTTEFKALKPLSKALSPQRPFQKTQKANICPLEILDENERSIYGTTRVLEKCAQDIGKTDVSSLVKFSYSQIDVRYERNSSSS